ncbi:RNA-directed DNA polymerase from mobile element jockey-like, partial [Paramuricea clavata]
PLTDRFQINFTALNKLVFIYLSLRLLSDGVEEYLILPSAWYYLKNLGETNEFLGLTLAAYSAGTLVFAPFIGFLAVKCQASKSLAVMCGLVKLFGNALYSIPVNGYFPLFGRFISGIGEGTVGMLYGALIKTARNKVNIELRSAKKDYYSSKIAGQKINPKKAWKSINNLLGRQNKPTVAITLSSFPDEWKVARVMPLYKNGQRSIPGNYRPISVLPAISKIMERILYDQLYNYLTKFELLSDSQFGFRKFHSTASALLDCTNDWHVNLDRKMFNLVVLIDLKKAFDTVDHQILLNKLELYGIKGQALTLLKSYLTNRNQKCQIQNSFSSERLIKCGVP